jgi:hypothetical protein
MMKNKIALSRKINNHSGITRAVVLMLVLVALMLIVIVAIPTVKYYKTEMGRIGCNTAFESARRRISEEYILASGEMTADEAKQVVTDSMYGWDDLCPAGGEVYLVKGAAAGLPYDVVCGLHGSDTRQVTRLNAERVLNRLKSALNDAQKNGTEYPETLTVKLNGKEITAKLVDEDQGIRWGTDSTSGVEGTVVFYGIKGHSDFGSNATTKDGQICYFCFADENHCADWDSRKGWSGDSFDGYNFRGVSEALG